VATAQMNTVIRRLRRVVLLQDGTERTDGQLLDSFIEQKDEAAFEALARRHGPMVLAVCRRVARNHHDAEDAFQATFLVLARKASSIRPRGLVANWLHGVAYRTALKARTMTLKRQVREKQVTELPEPEITQQNQSHDLLALIDQELNGLPENYRLPILLCDLEGKTIKEATQQLGWPQGTLAGRLARGRKLLAKRLANRGVVLSAGSLAVILSQHVASAGVPASLMTSTVKTATLIVAAQVTVAGMVPAKVVALMEGTMISMMLTKLSKVVVAGLVVLCLCGLGISGYQALIAQEPMSTTTPQQGIVKRADEESPKPQPPEAKKDRKQRDDEAKKDAESLQGRWAVESEVMDGVEPPAELLKAVVVVFKGDQMTFRPGLAIDATDNGNIKFVLDPQPDAMQFKLSQGSNPKAMQFTALEPDWRRRPCNAIYKHSGNNLTICLGAPDAPSPVEFTGKKGSKQVLWVLKRLPQEKLDAPKKDDGPTQKEQLPKAVSKEGSPTKKIVDIEKDAKVQEAYKRYGKDEGDAKRGPHFFKLAMLLHPSAYPQPPKTSESIAFKLLGEPDLFQEFTDDFPNEKHTSYIYLVDNFTGRTIPKEWKMTAGEKIAVIVNVRDGYVISVGWNTAPLKEDPPLVQKYKMRTKTTNKSDKP
jgi:RNA polymerase sigma factor (sigma-70 family)